MAKRCTEVMIAAAIGVKGEETGIEDGEKASDTSSSLTTSLIKRSRYNKMLIFIHSE